MGFSFSVACVRVAVRVCGPAARAADAITPNKSGNRYNHTGARRNDSARLWQAQSLGNRESVVFRWPPDRAGVLAGLLFGRRAWSRPRSWRRPRQPRKTTRRPELGKVPAKRSGVYSGAGNSLNHTVLRACTPSGRLAGTESRTSDHWCSFQEQPATRCFGISTAWFVRASNDMQMKSHPSSAMPLHSDAPIGGTPIQSDAGPPLSGQHPHPHSVDSSQGPCQAAPRSPRFGWRRAARQYQLRLARQPLPRRLLRLPRRRAAPRHFNPHESAAPRLGVNSLLGHAKASLQAFCAPPRCAVLASPLLPPRCSAPSPSPRAPAAATAASAAFVLPRGAALASPRLAPRCSAPLPSPRSSAAATAVWAVFAPPHCSALAFA